MDLYPCGCVLQGYLFAARVTGQAVVAAVMLKSSRLVKFVGICNMGRFGVILSYLYFHLRRWFDTDVDVFRKPLDDPITLG